MGYDRKMNRGVMQSLYKYLPETWIDFSVGGKEHKQLIAKVVRWNTELLTEINKARLIRNVNQRVHEFSSHGDSINPANSAVVGFGDGLTIDNCQVRKPKTAEVDRGIVAKMSPLTFYCKKCKKVYQFNSEEGYNKLRKCVSCHSDLEQFRQIYFCKCGYATDKHNIKCSQHGSKSIYWDGKYEFKCKICGKTIPMVQYCPICNERLGPKTALDSSQFYPFTLSLIDLIDEKTEFFLSENEQGKFLSIAMWIERITVDNFKKIVQEGHSGEQKDYNERYNYYLNVFSCLGEEQAAKSAKIAADNECCDSNTLLVNELKGKITASLHSLLTVAESIIEYQMVKTLPNHATLDDAKNVAELLNTNANPENYFILAEKYGFKNIQACDEIPFVACSYGYTRKKSEYEHGVHLHALKEESPGMKNIYATKMNTEGVLFEFDRKKIIQWIEKNNFISNLEFPNLDSEEDMKLWFVNNINYNSIHAFSDIVELESPVTYYVYRLIHSISHLLIRAAAEIGGLGKDSLSEYIFPAVPAVLIYCQNSQGFNLGSMFNTFEASFDSWIKRANTIAQKCVFDPICIERRKACTGCLFLNEVSCEHFNKDLDRSYVIGHFERKNNNRIYGFWEE